MYSCHTASSPIRGIIWSNERQMLCDPKVIYKSLKFNLFKPAETLYLGQHIGSSLFVLRSIWPLSEQVSLIFVLQVLVGFPQVSTKTSTPAYKTTPNSFLSVGVYRLVYIISTLLKNNRKFCGKEWFSKTTSFNAGEHIWRHTKSQRHQTLLGVHEVPGFTWFTCDLGKTKFAIWSSQQHFSCDLGKQQLLSHDNLMISKKTNSH